MNMIKYKEGIVEEQVGSSNGFWYDVTDGGYIIPSEILIDQKRVKELNNAIKLLSDWKDELMDDNILRDM